MKIKFVIAALQSFMGIAVVLLFVAVVLLGFITPIVDFQNPPMEAYEPGYAALDENFNHYVLPTTTGGFLYDTSAGFVYIDAIGRYIPYGYAGHPGDDLKLVAFNDTLSALSFEGLVQEKARVYQISMYLNVLLALFVIVLFDYYNLAVRIRNSKPLGSKLKLFSKPIKFSSSLVIIVAAVALILNVNTNGNLDFGKQTLAEPAVYYMPYLESQEPYYVDTSLGFLEYGNGGIRLDNVEVPIIRNLFVYDGHLVRSVNPINSNDDLIHLLMGLIMIFTALYVLNKLVQFNVDRMRTKIEK